jgi:hypothetical protein
MVVASFTPAATTSAIAQPIDANASPCGWPPPTPAPLYILEFPKLNATDVSPASMTVIVSANGTDHVVTLTSYRGAQSASRKEAAIPEWFRPLPDAPGPHEVYTFAGLRPGTVYVVSVQDSHWIPEAPCVAPEVFALGSFTTAGSP